MSSEGGLGGQFGDKDLASGAQPPQAPPDAASVAGPSGAFGELIERLRQAGLGDHVNSWISRGPNKVLDPQQVQQAVGPELAEMARQAGISTGEAARGLAKALPEVIDQMTPDGKMPTPDQAQQHFRHLFST